MRAVAGRGKLDRAGLDRACRLAVAQGERLSRVLTKLGLVSEHELARALADELGAPLVEARHIPAEPLELANLSPKFLRGLGVVRVRIRNAGQTSAPAESLD